MQQSLKQNLRESVFRKSFLFVGHFVVYWRNGGIKGGYICSHVWYLDNVAQAALNLGGSCWAPSFIFYLQHDFNI